MESRTLTSFANEFGYRHAQDLDENGKNIFHHLFTSMKYCMLSCEISEGCFKPNSGGFPGDIHKAMRHKVTGLHPKGWTPLHILCNGSDICLNTRDVIETLIHSGTVEVSDFDDNRNDQVVVLCAYVPTYILSS